MKQFGFTIKGIIKDKIAIQLNRRGKIFQGYCNEEQRPKLSICSTIPKHTGGFLGVRVQGSAVHLSLQIGFNQRKCKFSYIFLTEDGFIT